MGWKSYALFAAAILLVILGILCVAAHGIMPHPLHKPILPEELTPGGVFGGIVGLITGVVLIAVWARSGGMRANSAFMVLTGIFSIFLGVAALLDPVFGTLSYEWVIAVFVGLWGALAAVEALFASRIIGFKGWPIQLILGLIMVVAAVGVVYNSRNAALMACIAFIAAGISVAIIPLLGKNILATATVR